MSYLTNIKHQLRELVKNTPPTQLTGDLVDYVINQVLESYNNGLTRGLARPAKERKVNKQRLAA